MPPRLLYISYAVFVGLLIALILGFYWPWGLLFLYWVYVALRRGEVFLLGPIPRAQHPTFYGFVVLLWTLMGLLALASDLITL